MVAKNLQNSLKRKFKTKQNINKELSATVFVVNQGKYNRMGWKIPKDKYGGCHVTGNMGNISSCKTTECCVVYSKTKRWSNFSVLKARRNCFFFNFYLLICNCCHAEKWLQSGD